MALELTEEQGRGVVDDAKLSVGRTTCAPLRRSSAQGWTGLLRVTPALLRE